MGRPRKKGKRLPTLQKVAENKHTHWKRLRVREWYGEKQRLIEITSATAVWSHSGQPAVPIRWVIARDPKKRFKTQSLLCTDLSISAEQIVQWFPDVGRSKSRSTKLGLTSAWRLNDNGQTSPSCESPQPC
jgi:hypothetical protein